MWRLKSFYETAIQRDAEAYLRSYSDLKKKRTYQHSTTNAKDAAQQPGQKRHQWKNKFVRSTIFRQTEKKENQTKNKTPNFNQGSLSLLLTSGTRRGSSMLFDPSFSLFSSVVPISFPGCPFSSFSARPNFFLISSDSFLQNRIAQLQVFEVHQARKTAKSAVINHSGKTRLQITPTLTPSNIHGSDKRAMS
ncbi:hypothetical protein Ahy_B10g100867 isoform D [Arachis hypogaea]|uniref:Uncharacterized protein n=1 Tax=Arachis hypogaea TaxID=3818 RepID=A0A444WXX5_ARAHY|nr:hypothetical protein Ahy_B10g100867 isoform D [Arachis hypogaea]